ncbi:MAG: tail fiber domain-containing protein [Salibacteraceae bacterium]
MKKHYRVFSAALVAMAMTFAGSTSAQSLINTLFTPTGGVSNGGPNGIGVNANPALATFDVVGNNLLIRPSNNFNPNGKFIGIGESGGVVGPINGCDLYGFRAQRAGNAFINVGLRQNGFTGGDPTISWGSEFTFFGSTIPKVLRFTFDNTDASCGTDVVWMESPNNAFQLRVFGDAQVGTLFQTSDARYKENIQPIGNAMSLISQIEGTTYTMNREAFPERNFDEGTQYGFIAQNLQKVMPEMVRADEEGFLSVNYTGLIPVLVEGLKEQQELVDAQNDQIDAQNTTIEAQNLAIEAQNQELTAQGEELEAAQLANEELNNQVQEQQAVLEQQDLLIRQIMEDLQTLKNADPAGKGNSASTGETSQLFQNRPNPFRESTEIHFYLPTDVEQATLVIYSLDGKELMSFNNLDRGYGNVLVEGSELQPGNYVYRLVADNQVVDSKTLVLSK